MATRSIPEVTGSDAPLLFLSYARSDQRNVEKLAHALEKAGYAVWWDAHLAGGHHFSAEIERALSAADAVVVVWSEDAVASHWVLDEATAGRDRGCLIPVRFDDTPPPMGFRQIQVIDLGPDPQESAAAIHTAASRIVEKPLPTAAARFAQLRKKVKVPKEKPWWTPFAWVGVGIFIWILSKLM